ncbi:PsbP-related protein [Elusimicrobiota bacterium]
MKKNRICSLFTVMVRFAVVSYILITLVGCKKSDVAEKSIVIETVKKGESVQEGYGIRKTYTDQLSNYTVSYPDNWRLSEATGVIGKTTLSIVSSGSEEWHIVTITFDAVGRDDKIFRDVSSNADAREHILNHSQKPDFKIVKSGKAKISGKKALFNIYKKEASGGGTYDPSIRLQSYALESDGIIYVINYQVVARDADKYFDVYTGQAESIIKSVKIGQS